MAGSSVPTTLRASFFNDNFFKATWDDFEEVRENMFRESRDMWKNFEEEFKKIESFKKMKSSSSQLSPQNRDVTEMNTRDTGSGSDRGSGWMLPRMWMTPSMFNSDFAKQMELFQTKDSEEIRVKDDQEKFEVSLDASQYKPDELRVSVGEGVLSVEGKHDEKSKDGSRVVLRQFARKYTLPAEAKAENVVSNLSSDGVLVVSVPKKEAITNE